MIKIYLSGPISGLPYEQAVGTFDEAARLALERVAPIFFAGASAEIVNPLNNGLPVEAPYNAHITADIALLLECDVVVMLRGWHTSKGARVENFIANTYGKDVVYLPA